MTRVFYLGNKCFSYTKVKGVMETLEPLLGEFCDLKTASKYKNMILRFGDMLLHFLIYGLRADKIIIDVYSTFAFNFALVFGGLSSIFGKKYILFLHGGNLPSRFLQCPRSVNWLFRKAYLIIAPSPYLAQFFRSKGFEVLVIPNIIPLEEYPFKERENVRASILALRGFGKPYNPLMTLNAINLLKVQLKGLKMLMLGNSDEFYFSEVIEYIKKNKLDEIVEIRSKMPKREWVVLSQDYDIMVSNPIIDNTPISLIEGMALGMCVVSTKVGGVPYLFGDKECVMVESNDAEALCIALLKLLHESDYAVQQSRNGRKKAELFDWSKVKGQWEKVLEV